MQSLKKRTEGFTIIEVMIVLVIAAVIILIVFLAVPALQRNSRNNQRKNDASRVSAAVTEVANNSNGTLPTTNTAVTNVVGTLGFYTSLTYDGDGTSNPVESGDTITYVRGGVCTGGNGSTPGSGRQFVILYAVENSASGSTTPQCLQG